VLVVHGRCLTRRREVEDEPRALDLGRLDPQAAPVRLGDQPRDVEPDAEAGAAVVVPAAGAQLEEPLGVVRRDPEPVVADLDGGLPRRRTR
jgi:hypothetical protein